MSCIVKIKLNERVNIDEANSFLEEMKAESRFITEKDNMEWLEDINNNPMSPSRHLKPKEKDLTLQELKSMFSAWTEVGLLQIDVAFNRTGIEEMKRIAKFIYTYSDLIDYGTNLDTLIERSKIAKKYHIVILDKERKMEEPKLLPKSKQHIPNVQSGLFLCKSFSLNPFWVIFGNVTNPQYMYTKIYEENLYNNIYKDTNNYSYMLLPQLNGTKGLYKKVFDSAWEIGLREHFDFIMPLLYKIDIADTNKVGSEFARFYSLDELTSRFSHVVKEIIEASPNKNCIYLKDGDIIIESITVNNATIQLLNALKLALENSIGNLKRIDNNTFCFSRKDIAV